jgi:hypothetical protein
MCLRLITASPWNIPNRGNLYHPPERIEQIIEEGEVSSYEIDLSANKVFKFITALATRDLQGSSHRLG